MRTFERQGLVFDVDDTGGSGEVVILLHGFPQSKQAWSLVGPRLAAEGYRVVAPNQRGYSPGARPPGRRNYAFAELVDDVLALADAAAAERFHLVGHDWGGAISWALAARHPERVTTLTSLSMPHPKAYRRAMVGSDQALRAWYILFYQLPWLPEATLTGRVLDGAVRRTLTRSGLPPWRVDQYLGLMGTGAAKPAVDWYRALPLLPPGTFSPVSVPTLYVWGTDDPWLGRRAAELSASYARGPYRFEVLDGEGHWLPEQAPERVTSLILDHLTRTGRPGSAR